MDKLVLDSEALAPCPFCGGTNMLVLSRTCDKNTPYDPNDRAMPAVRCMTCYGEAVGKDWSEPKTAIAAWNRRVPPTQALEANRMREALQEMTEAFEPFASKPVGAPGSLARQEQARQIKAQFAARAALHPIAEEPKK